MNLRRDDLKRIARAPAKLNLVLDVMGRREDGFHEVETLMVPVRLADSVSLTPVPPVECRVSGQICLDVYPGTPLWSSPEAASVPAGSDNLVVRALKLLQQRSGCEWGARVELVKRIPVAAGLGGGSSDAAAALKLANRAWKIHWSDDRLAALAAEIGSDVPFFLSSGAAICRGRGERIERLPPIPPLEVVIVKPPVEFSTADVYCGYDALPEDSVARTGRLSGLLAALAAGHVQDLGRQMRNALEKAASSVSPWVDKLRMVFDELDFVGHQLTGSGSAYFGICRHAQHARRLANILRMRQLGLVYATRSCQ